jgi:hypothetical protein
MSKETLSKLRIFVPGTMLIVVLALLGTPLLLSWYAADPKKATSALGSVGSLGSTIISVLLLSLSAYVLGGIYRILGVRNRLLRHSKDRIDSNITEGLLDPYMNQDPIAGAAEGLREDHRLLNVFYHFIDNKESLKERAKGVYLNGLLWSSVADLMAVTLLLLFTSLVACLFFWRTYYLSVAVLAGGLYLLASWVLMPRVVERHIFLGGEQIDFILQLHESELRSKLEELATSVQK